MKTILMAQATKKNKADLLVVGNFEKGKADPVFSALEPAAATLLKSALDKGRFTGKSGELFSLYSENYVGAEEIVMAGLGGKAHYAKSGLRKIVGKITAFAKGRRAVKVRVLLESFLSEKVSRIEAAEIFSEISRLAAYEFDRYKTKKEEEGSPERKEIILELLETKKAGGPAIRKAIEISAVIAEASIFARNLVNEPGNILTPSVLARRAKEMAAAEGIACKVLGKADMTKLKMGGILAVNQGSPEDPALIILEYGERFKSKKNICLVGKGVTFDTGGISIKPSKDMEKMKYDMAGAAAVIGSMQAIARLKLPLYAVALIPAVENNVAQNPQRPGDIIRMFNGKTVEVLNTDAEGRLILADALAYAAKFSPKAIVDLATLTGACAYTFGDKAIGLLGNDERLLKRIQQAGEDTGERCWQLPLWEEYGKVMKGHHSDLYNIGTGGAGTITAAMFLKEFVPEKTPWAHLDIAGTAWCDSPRFDAAKGATGVGVRLILQLLRNWK